MFEHAMCLQWLFRYEMGVVVSACGGKRSHIARESITMADHVKIARGAIIIEYSVTMIKVGRWKCLPMMISGVFARATNVEVGLDTEL